MPYEFAWSNKNQIKLQQTIKKIREAKKEKPKSYYQLLGFSVYLLPI